MKYCRSTTFPVIATLGLLAGCSVVGKLGGKSKPDVPGGDSVAEAAGGEEMPIGPRSKLEELQKHLDAKAWNDYVGNSKYLHNSVDPEGDYKGEPYRDAVAERLAELDAAAYKEMGGRLFALVGDGARVRDGVDTDVLEEVAATLAACGEAGKSHSGPGADAESAKALAAYEKQVARVKKLDPKAFRYRGEDPKGRSIDVPIELATCEIRLALTQGHMAETYVAEVAGGAAADEVGCGVIEWHAQGVRTGSGKFAPLSFSGDTYYPTKVACSELPKQDKVSPAVADAVKAFRDHHKHKGMKFVTVGKPTVEVGKDELHVYKFQTIKAYAKDFTLGSNPCGDLKIFCEVGGSKGAEAYNRMEFALDRAAVHAGKDPDKCREHLKTARERATWFEEFHADMVKRGEWISGSTYRTKKGAKLKEKDFIASFAAKGKLADDRLLDKYCTKAPAVAGKVR